jgi:hypothetical protein
MNSSQYDYLPWNRRRRISLPDESADELMAVPKRDFKRLQKHIEDELKPQTGGYTAASSAFFGAMVAIVVTTPSLMDSKSLPSWMVPTFIVSASACLIIGLVLAIVARKSQRRRSDAVAEIVQDMSDIEEACRGRRPVSRL